MQLAVAEASRRISAAIPEHLYKETHLAESFLFTNACKRGISLQLMKDELVEILLDIYWYPGFP
jgi:hypothetical protein